MLRIETNKVSNLFRTYLINQTPGKKLRHGVALRASAALVESCELLSQ
jgi:hypothetical protein